ncbi:MAG: HPr family phosphocarrier protein [Phycisphaerales bacterium]|nr:HPr family phosphocarrier protein [Phycisphaerales bacterium]
MPSRTQITVTIVNRLGLHARPAMSFVDAAQAFKCSVKVQKGDFEVDGKSIMEVMMLAATKGTKLDVICEGDDADHCAKALSKLVAEGFGED